MLKSLSIFVIKRSHFQQQRERSMHVINEMQAELRAMRGVAAHRSAQRTSSTREAILGRRDSLTPTDPVSLE